MADGVWSEPKQLSTVGRGVVIEIELPRDRLKTSMSLLELRNHPNNTKLHTPKKRHFICSKYGAAFLWFWFVIRVNVSAEGHPWYEVIFADLFVLSLLATQLTALFFGAGYAIYLSDVVSLNPKISYMMLTSTLEDGDYDANTGNVVDGVSKLGGLRFGLGLAVHLEN